MHQAGAETAFEASTFECLDCRTRVPTTWVDYDMLGYGVCPECGSTQGSRTAAGHGTSGSVR